MAELSGEQKLRIVLESIIRNVPKEEQCKKYGVTEQDFQSWHDHLIKDGGKIFEPEFDQSAAYIEGWVEAMRANKNVIFKAAAEAQKAVDYLLALAKPQTEEEAA